MKYCEALVAWTPGTDLIRVGELIADGAVDWTDHPIRYESIGGAAHVNVSDVTDPMKAAMLVFRDFAQIVVSDDVPPSAVHEQFLKIDEYRQHIEPEDPELDAYDDEG